MKHAAAVQFVNGGIGNIFMDAPTGMNLREMTEKAKDLESIPHPNYSCKYSGLSDLVPAITSIAKISRDTYQ